MEPDSEEVTPERQFTISYSQHYSRPQSLQSSPAEQQVGISLCQLCAEAGGAGSVRPASCACTAASTDACRRVHV